MPTEEEALFSAVDALLEQVAQDDLPPPAERKRLREAAGLSQAQIATALGARREAVGNWEAGRTEPRPPKRAAYARLLEGLASRFPSTAPAVPAAFSGTPTEPPPAPAAAPEEPAVKKAVSTSRRPAARKAAPKKPVASPAAAAGTDERFANGPLGVLDGDGSLYCVGGLVLDCPAKTVPALVEWTLAEARLGSPRLHRHGKDGDPLIVLTHSAAERFGLPAILEDRRGLRLPDDHKVIKQLTKAGWQLSGRGFSPWTRIFRPMQQGKRRCVQLAVLPWDALDVRSWGDTGHLPAPDVAAVLGTYATRVLTPRGTTAVCGLELMTALRPPTRAVKDEATGAFVPGPVPGSLTRPIAPAWPEAPDEHPVLAGRFPAHHVRTPAETLNEESWTWFRQLTDQEVAEGYTHAVGIDVNMAFAAAANRLNVGLGPAREVTAPEFDPKLPGSWLVDLSGIETDPRLPSPFTPDGERPDGPAWYSTTTVGYATELGAHVEPIQAFVREESGYYLDPWYQRLRDAYVATMADLGVTTGMSENEFLAAMADYKSVDPQAAAVLSAIKATAKGGIGKLQERPRSIRHKRGEPWPALKREAWSPHVRAEVIAKTRTNTHRKMTRLAAVGLYPVAVNHDCAVYLSHGPSPLDFLPHTDDGKPLPGGFRLGVSPGMVKHEGTQSFLWLAEMIENQHANPAREIKGPSILNEGE
ncbi:helix-turn-helix domain-containing protein [Streptomyces sp. MCA2]|uniref:telomere-associated protein Tap n=1 Tax=Streptomyces sp. MCA2 TaxID=2944805 RepID=UPI00202153A7|nr:helix-turn-helix transcriptional regulator [Streptomyces sp. MCA2]MCL7496030.1 helix-turn-helix domain-containing protein [Streptomyces sp. MCA2]